MGGADPPSQDDEAVTAELGRLLDDAADERTRRYWERYLKGAVPFRGVPMAGVRAAVGRLWRQHGLADRSPGENFALAHHWFACAQAEDKLAAVLLIAEHLAPALVLGHHVELARPLEDGHVADWGTCDWYANKALHAYLTGGHDMELRARALAAWTAAPGLWQRRAGLVAFARVARTADRHFDGLVALILDACAANLVSAERFAHTGPGWVLRELSAVAPTEVARFVDEHPELSHEARRMATARLRPGPYRRR